MDYLYQIREQYGDNSAKWSFGCKLLPDVDLIEIDEVCNTVFRMQSAPMSSKKWLIENDWKFWGNDNGSIEVLM